MSSSLPSDPADAAWQARGKFAQLASARGINGRGQIVGWAETMGGGRRDAFLWENGKMRDLGTLGGRGSSAALAINERGQGGGKAADHAVLWRKTG